MARDLMAEDRIERLRSEARRLMKMRSTKELVSDFLATSDKRDPRIPMVRGWIMDELERRNPKAYERWIDSEECRDEDLPKYFGC